MIKEILLIAVLFGTTHSFAQTVPPLINSGNEIAEGQKLYEEKQYKKAIDCFSKIPIADTNYVLAQYELAHTYMADSQYTKALFHCEQGLKHPFDRDRLPDILNLKGMLYDEMGNSAYALHLYDSALAIYPAHINFYLNKGKTLFYQQKYDQAADEFKKGLLISPYSSLLHFNLAVTALRQGNTIAAFLGFTANLIMDPEGDYSGASISLLNNIAQGTDDIVEGANNRKINIPESFTLTEQIVLSKIALEKNYKPIISLDDKISRQMQVIFEKLEYDANDNDFWMQYYVPYFKKIYADKRFEALVNYAFSSVDIDQIKKYNKDHAKDIKKFEEDLFTYFNLIRQTRQLNAQRRGQETIGYFFANGKLASRGLIAGKTLTGDWTFFYPAGNIKSAGRFNEKEEKLGTWKYYYFDGSLQAEEKFNSNNNSTETYYYDNGNIYYTAFYNGKKLHGKKTAYYREGNIKYVENYSNGELDGEYIEYYPSGQEKSRVKYINGKMEGPFTIYGTNGKLEKRGTYLDGEVSGAYMLYYNDGSVGSEYLYDKGLLNGTQKNYHRNGKLKTLENYYKGQLEGEYAEYYDNGQLYYTCNYKKGIHEGDIRFYDRDGIMYSVISYEKDLPASARYYDKKGNEISSSVKNKTFVLTAYSPDGFKRSETPYNDKGIKEGLTKFFYKSGKLSEENNYKDGKLNGKLSVYHPNNKLLSAVEYEDDKRHGYFTSYYINGKKQEEGWYADGEQKGRWIYYDEQGNISYISDFENGRYHGIHQEFWPNGKIKTESFYLADQLQNLKQYDTLGKEINRVEIKNGNGKYKLVHLNGTSKEEGTYVNGNLHGKYIFYFFDGTREEERYYKAGEADSIYRSYFYGGKLRAEGQYLVGEKSGIWKYYKRDGRLSYIEKYKNGELADSTVHYHANGKVSLIISYENGERNGVMKKFDDEGVLIYSINYEDGLAKSYTYLDNMSKLVTPISITGDVTKVKTYYPNGKLSAEFDYHDNRVNGPDNAYFSNGKPEMLSAEVYNVSEGPIKYFFRSGKPHLEYSFSNGNIHGLYKKYHEAGTLSEQSDYYNGGEHGETIIFDEKLKPIEKRYYYYGDLISAKK